VPVRNRPFDRIKAPHSAALRMVVARAFVAQKLRRPVIFLALRLTGGRRAWRLPGDRSRTCSLFRTSQRTSSCWPIPKPNIVLSCPLSSWRIAAGRPTGW